MSPWLHRLLVCALLLPSRLLAYRRRGGYMSKRRHVSAGFGAKQDSPSPLNEGWRSIAADYGCPATGAFDALRKMRKEREQKSASVRSDAKAGIYTSLAEVMKHSQHINAMQIAVPAGLKNSVLQFKYTPPIESFVPTVMGELENRTSLCDVANFNLREEIEAREKRKAENDEGQYAECVLSAETLPRLTGKRMAQLYQHAGDHTSDFGDWFRVLEACDQLHLKQPPQVRPASTIPGDPYLLYTKDAVVLDIGSIHSVASKLTEHFIPPWGCYNWGALVSEAPHCNSDFYQYHNVSEPGNPGFYHKPVDAVFVIAQSYGNQFFHFMAECLPRLALFYCDLLKDSSIKIQVTEENALVTRYMQFLGFPRERLVSGFLRANEVFVPQEVGCGMASRALWQVNMMREQILGRLALTSQPFVTRAGTIVLINRDGTQNARRENQEEIAARKKALQVAFPQLEVKEFKDADAECIECTVQTFNGASVIIGQHGAGLSNMLYARVDTLLIEFDSRGGNLCFMDLAYTLGLRYHLTSKGEYTRRNELKEGWGFHLIRAVKEYFKDRGLGAE